MKLQAFGPAEPLAQIASAQAQYLRCYLKDLGASLVLEEPSYFDRDFLSEHSAFYGTTAAQYPSHCRRLHFFRSVPAEQLERALGGDVDAHQELQRAYLGFVVLRPLPHAPLGRTVVAWYPDETDRYSGNPRVVTPSRSYRVHLAGLELFVTGLAWQQQDGAVALCASTAVWSLLHSSAFDDHHAIPTTASVTEFAVNRRAAFPALEGLRAEQVVEAIARAQLRPVVIDSDVWSEDGGGFSRSLFSTICAAVIRSGYPVVLSGVMEGGDGHMVCLTGFRERGPADGSVFQDEGLEFLYLHDDNLGPNVRHVIELDETERVLLRASAPAKRYEGERLPDPTEGHDRFIPTQLIIATHEGISLLPGALRDLAEQVTRSIQDRYESESPLVTTFQFAKLSTYLGSILPKQFTPENGTALARVRREVVESFPAMSLHLGIVRVGHASGVVADLLVDASHIAPATQATINRWRVFGTLVFAPLYREAIDQLATAMPFGKIISVG